MVQWATVGPRGRRKGEQDNQERPTGQKPNALTSTGATVRALTRATTSRWHQLLRHPYGYRLRTAGKSIYSLMQWLHVQFIECTALQLLCNNCRLSNVLENIHGCSIFASWIFSITLESLIMIIIIIIIFFIPSVSRIPRDLEKKLI